MDNYSDMKTAKELVPSVTTEEKITRRNFAKKAVGLGFLSSLTLLNLPEAAQAWLDGGFAERDDLGDALKVLERTYNGPGHYPHKFYDGLVKVHLRNLDFAVKKGLEKEHAQHYVDILGVVVEKYIKKNIPKMGKDIFLWGVFERTSCSYQLYEWIDIKEGERSFPCPFEYILGKINKSMGTYDITWNDVCEKWCSPVWHGFAKKAGDIKIKVEPGKTCKVKLA
jgi:hypothetical protein